MRNQATFRDPEGFCFARAGRIFRVVTPQAAERVRGLLAHRLVLELTKEGKLPATRTLSLADFREIDSALCGEYLLSADHLILEHRRIPFVSYAHEWSAEMLFAAGMLTLEIQLRAVDAGLTLKDATPHNVVFEDARPVFVDLLSLSPREEGLPIWPAYAQFVRTFVLPLLYYRELGSPSHESFLRRRDGLQPDEVYRAIGWARRLKPSVLRFVSAPVWLGRMAKANTVSPRTVARTPDARAEGIVRLITESARNAYRGLRPAGQTSLWEKYVETKSYTQQAGSEKMRFVLAALRALGAQRVLDIGCNTGEFSIAVAREFESVVALDTDPASVSALTKVVHRDGLRVLPLLVDFARPTPALGWKNGEQHAFLARARGHFDAALLLAVIHHLSITDGIPLGEIFELVAQLVRRGCVVEYVPPDDPMFRRIIRNKEHLIPSLSQEAFEAAFAPWFKMLEKLVMPDSGRVLYSLVKLPGENGTSAPS